MAGLENDFIFGKNADFSAADNQNALEANGLFTNGQIWIGRTAVNAGGTHIDVGTLSGGTGIVVTNGAGTISISTSGSSVGNTITGDTGGPLSPTAGNWNIIGAGSITTAGSGSTLTAQLTGLTANSILFGQGTTTIGKVTPVNSAVLVTTAAGLPVLTSSMTNGQFVLGSTGATPAAGSITSTGGTITVTAGAGTLNLDVTGGGFTWNDITSATQTLAVQNGYATDRGAGVTYTLPSTAVFGSEIIIVGKLGLTNVAQNANQQILMGSSSSTVGVTGSIAGTNVGDSVTLIAASGGSSTVWRAVSWVGNWTVS